MLAHAQLHSVNLPLEAVALIINSWIKYLSLSILSCFTISVLIHKINPNFLNQDFLI